MRKHNDKDEPYHLKLFEFCVIVHECDAAHDIVRIKFSSLWMLSNALCAINAGWVFQLNGDVTGNVCRADIDLLELYLPKTMCFAFQPFRMLPRARELMKSHGMTCAQLSCFPSASSTAAMTAVSVAQPWRS